MRISTVVDGCEGSITIPSLGGRARTLTALQSERAIQ